MYSKQWTYLEVQGTMGSSQIQTRYGFLDEVIYVEQPHLFAMEMDKVCKLINALYGLKQAPHFWYKTLVEFLKRLGFIRLEFDHGIFVSADKQLFIPIYVDFPARMFPVERTCNSNYETDSR